jgi:hypothetical protein
MRVRRGLPLAVCLLSVGALTWLFLSRPPSPSVWCALESQSYGTVGQPFHVRVTLRKPLSAQDVKIDLHWATVRTERRGFLIGATHTPGSGRALTLDVTVDVPARDALGYIYAVVFVSPTASWADHTLAAISEPVVVHRAASAPASATLHPLAVYDENDSSTVAPTDSRVVRICIALSWLLSAAACWRLRHQPGVHPLIVSCVVAASWELSSVERVLASSARNFMFEQGLYYGRQTFQIITTTIVVTSTAGLALFTLGRARGPSLRAAWIGFWLYAGTAIAGLISLHNVDALLAATVAGVSAQQIARLSAAFIAFLVTMRIRRPRVGEEGTT